MRLLSKSRILSGLQCAKRLYLETHHPGLGETSKTAEKAFNIGHQVTAMARLSFPDGMLIGYETDIQQALYATDTALADRPGDITLFEPAFSFGDAVARTDILIVCDGRVAIKEVKSSSSVKPTHITDAAIQAWILQGLGYTVDSVSILHINTDFVYQGDGNYSGLFHEADITDQIGAIQDDIPGWLDAFRHMLEDGVPAISMGPHCSSPYPCQFKNNCTAYAPEYPVSMLPRAAKLAKQLEAMGYSDLRDVPPDLLNNDMQRRIQACSKNNAVYVSDDVAEQLSQLPYPRYYLDFESVQFPIPIWAGTRPFDQLPFQWSCHIEHDAGSSLEHKDYLAESGKPPMRQFTESLITCLGSDGPVLVYSNFERTTIRQLQQRFPDLVTDLENIVDRLVDLLPVAEQHYYHPAMKGSWSIKAVLPTIAPELDYKALSVQDGNMAQMVFLEMIDNATGGERRDEIRAALLEYCGQDTLAMVRLFSFFQEFDHTHKLGA